MTGLGPECKRAPCLSCSTLTRTVSASVVPLVLQVFGDVATICGIRNEGFVEKELRTEAFSQGLLIASFLTTPAGPSGEFLHV
jgi:hypothetical protein